LAGSRDAGGSPGALCCSDASGSGSQGVRGGADTVDANVAGLAISISVLRFAKTSGWFGSKNDRVGGIAKGVPRKSGIRKAGASGSDGQSLANSAGASS